jgi:hypothetical protein
MAINPSPYSFTVRSFLHSFLFPKCIHLRSNFKLQNKSENSKFSKNSQKNIWRSVHQYESTSVFRFSRWCPDSPEIAVKLAKLKTLRIDLGVSYSSHFSQIAFWVSWRLASGVDPWWLHHLSLRESRGISVLGFENPNVRWRHMRPDLGGGVALGEGRRMGLVGGDLVSCTRCYRWSNLAFMGSTHCGAWLQGYAWEKGKNHLFADVDDGVWVRCFCFKFYFSFQIQFPT